jgi:hypothetical protein
MSVLLDNVARILAGPTSRRQTLKLLGGMLAGVVLGTIGIGRAKAQASCGGRTCNKNQHCCGSGDTATCISDERTCCGTTSCNKNQTCCNNECCSPNQTCGNGRCSASNK